MQRGVSVFHYPYLMKLIPANIPSMPFPSISANTCSALRDSSTCPALDKDVPAKPSKLSQGPPSHLRFLVTLRSSRRETSYLRKLGTVRQRFRQEPYCVFQLSVTLLCT